MENNAPETPPFTLVITLTNGTKVDVNGPLRNKIVCLGLFEMAKQILFDYNDKIDAEEAAKATEPKVITQTGPHPLGKFAAKKKKRRVPTEILGG